jgi:hypothetical protein
MSTSAPAAMQTRLRIHTGVPVPTPTPLATGLCPAPQRPPDDIVAELRTHTAEHPIGDCGSLVRHFP